MTVRWYEGHFYVRRIGLYLYKYIYIERSSYCLSNDIKKL